MNHNHNNKKTRSFNTRFLFIEYDKLKRIIHFDIQTEYGFKCSTLWYPCETISEYEIIHNNLRQYNYWKVKFYKNTGQIIQMRAIRDRGCIIQ
jgi:hypothetical protein